VFENICHHELHLDEGEEAAGTRVAAVAEREEARGRSDSGGSGVPLRVCVVWGGGGRRWRGRGEAEGLEIPRRGVNGGVAVHTAGGEGHIHASGNVHFCAGPDVEIDARFVHNFLRNGEWLEVENCMDSRIVLSRPARSLSAALDLVLPWAARTRVHLS